MQIYLLFYSAVPATSHAPGSTNLGAPEIDLLGSLSDSLALVPATATSSETDASVSYNAGPFAATTSASSVPGQVGVFCIDLLDFLGYSTLNILGTLCLLIYSAHLWPW